MEGKEVIISENIDKNKPIYTYDQRKLIGKNVAYFRENRRWSQQELGAKVGKSLGWMNKFENFDEKKAKNQWVRYDGAIISALADALYIPFEWLFETEDNRPAPADIPQIPRHDKVCEGLYIPSDRSEMDKLIEQLRELSPKQLAILELALIEIKE